VHGSVLVYDAFTGIEALLQRCHLLVVVVVVSLVSQEGVVGCGRAEVWVGWRTFVAELGVFLHG